MMVMSIVTGCTGTSTVSPTPPTPTPQASPAGIMTPRSPEKSLATKTLETKLRTAIAKKSGIPVQTIQCPDQIPVQANAPFNCQATAEGQTFTIAINSKEDNSKDDKPKNNKHSKDNQKIDKNELQWSTKGLLVIPKLEQTIQQGIKQQFNVAVKTSCGGKVRAAKQGDQFQCKIIDNRGQARAVNVRVDDEKGNVTWKL